MLHRIALSAVMLGLGAVLAWLARSWVVALLVLGVVVAVWTWEGLADWVKGFQDRDEPSRLGDLSPTVEPNRRPRARVSALMRRSRPGPGDRQGLDSVALDVSSHGDPFQLVVRGRLTEVRSDEDYRDGTEHTWSYEPRQVLGGHGLSSYELATISTNETDSGRDWLLKLRGEHMNVERRWEGLEPFECDLEFELLQLHESTLHRLQMVRVRLRVTDEWTLEGECLD
jgi:hypothetical protein